ncbi:MAG: prepilin-type N-terminal cleavage/methylation domain-containing protein [Patescibacteria group bacterium]|jgi:prepilin-type N-terminal cleavage/methylation domain-containing protein|nr:prepilin-type N-terminal cleavage/methylation domain-containing protein [Patescibacteria group bacterium]
MMAKGFTLVELLIVFAILGIVAVFSIPFIQSFQVSSDLYTQADTLTKTLRRARQQAIIGQNQAAWGVYFDNGNKEFILYQGTDFISRDSSFDTVFEYPPTFELSTDFGQEVNFRVFSGDASVSGTVILTSTNNQSSRININDSGLIEIND